MVAARLLVTMFLDEPLLVLETECQRKYNEKFPDNFVVDISGELLDCRQIIFNYIRMRP